MKETRILLIWVFVALTICFGAAFAKRYRHHSKLTKLGQRKDKVLNHRHKLEKKYGNAARLERRFETIRDLGSIVRCRLRNEETTVVTGNSLICGGKRYLITPEAAKDVEETATTKQSISFSPEGSPQGLLSTLKSGLYGKPIMSFLGQSQGFLQKQQLEPHDRYPAYGIFDKGLRSADPALFTSSKPASVSFEQGSNSLSDISDSQLHNFGSMELGDISHTLNSDNLKTEDSFYRNERLQNGAIEMSGKDSITSNPFAQYWKSLNAGFYETTRSQLGDSEQDTDNRHETPYKSQLRAKIPKRREEKLSTKKSNIQQKQKSDSSARKTIPKPAGDSKTASNKNKATAAPGHKRYYIFGEQDQYPLGMFAGIPIGPWQFNNRDQMSLMREFNRPAMTTQDRLPMQRLPSVFDRTAAQPGFTRSINRADEWGSRAVPRYFDPRATGSPIRVPLNPIYAQMRANEFAGEPGLPTRGKFQYGVQPGNGPPFMGFVSVPIMQQIGLGNSGINHPGFHSGFQPAFNPGFPENGEMDGGIEAGQDVGGYSRGTMPFNYEKNDESATSRANTVPGMVRGTEQEISSSNQPVGLAMDGGMGNNGQMFGPNQEEGYEREMLDESASNAGRSASPQEDANEDFEKITGPENYVPAPFYQPPSYNPHESEDFFPDGTNQKFQNEGNSFFQKNGYSGSQRAYKEEVQGPEGNAAEIYEDEKRQEEEKEMGNQERKRTALGSATRIDVNGNKIEQDPDGKFILTKEHVGFGPITVEAKTAKSAMKDPSDDDD